MMALVGRAMGSGLPAGLANSLLGDVGDGLTATGSSQADAQKIGTGIARFTTVAAGTGGILPRGAVGDGVLVVNDGANALSLYPPVGHTINAGSANEAVSVAATASLMVKRITNTAWLALTSAELLFLQVGAGAVSRTVQSKERDVISVLDFIPAALHAGIAARTNTTDLAPYIQAAIDAVTALGGGKLLFPAGDCRIESTLTVQGLVTLVGEGAGRTEQPTVAAATKIMWYGGASIMVDFGAQASVKADGGIEGIRLDGRAIATRCLRIKDHQHGRFKDVLLTGAITHALEMTNTDGLDPTGFSIFDDLQISLRGGSTDSANGIYLNGVGTGVAGVTINSFRNPRIEHANGNGLMLGLRADGNLFENFYAFRASTTESGYGIRFDSTDTGAVNTTNRFEGNTIAVGGISIAVPSTGGSSLGMMGSDFQAVNVVELASDLTDRTNPLISLGRNLVFGGTDQGLRLGFSRLQHQHQGHTFDAMRFMSFDSTNLFLYTNDGVWFVVRNGAGGTIASAAQPGGAIALMTGGTSGNDIAIYGAADFTSGITYSSNPIIEFDATPVSTTDIRTQFGLFGDSTLPDPTNGVYVQFDPAVNANVQLIARKAGVSTTITTSIAGAAAKRQWLICLDDTQNAMYFTKLPSAVTWTYLGTNTNTPTVVLIPGYRVETNTGGAKEAHIYHHEFGHVHE